jgi:DNA-binding CsgD family transcriptional regulator
MEWRLASAEAMANASPTATFVVTRQGEIRHQNTAAETLLRIDDGLSVKNGVLTATDRRLNQALMKLLVEVEWPSFSAPDCQAGHFLAIPRPSGKRPLQFLATPLPQTHRHRANADLLLLVTDPESRSIFPDDSLHALYDFTPAEIEVANGLLMGYTPEEIASLRRVSTGTVRQQIKRMFLKTGTTRQVDMIRLFTTLPRP